MNYSKLNPVILDKRKRLQVARQIFNLLRIHLGRGNLKDLKVLDVGCSSGIISNYLADHFGKVIGIDVDHEAILQAQANGSKKNVQFSEINALKMPFQDGKFDIIISNQSYYYSPSHRRFINEIRRVLKPGGICFLTARNPYTAIYHREAGSIYLLTQRQLKRLCSDFKIYHYTPQILANPNKFGFKFPLSRLISVLPEFIWKKLEPFSPNFIWILEKP